MRTDTPHFGVRTITPPDATLTNEITFQKHLEIMKIVLLGATGLTGQEALSQALKAGHEVTAVVRSPEKITIQNDNLKVSIIWIPSLICLTVRKYMTYMDMGLWLLFHLLKSLSIPLQHKCFILSTNLTLFYTSFHFNFCIFILEHIESICFNHIIYF